MSGVPASRIEVRRLDDPALDGAAVEGGIPPDLLDFAEGRTGEQVFIERGELPHGLPLSAHRCFAGHVRPTLVEREGAVVRDREGAAAVGAAVGGAAKALPENRDLAVERHGGDLRVALVVVLEVEAVSVRSPHRIRDAPVEAAGNDALAASVEVHDLEAADLVGPHPILVSHERNLLPVGRNGGAVVGSLPVGQRADLPARDRSDVELGVAVVVYPVGVAVRREDEVPAVRRPGGRARVLEVTGSHLDRRAAFHGQHEDMVVTEVEIAHPVLPVLEAVLHDRGIGPLRPRGRLRRRGELGRRVGNQHVEGEPPAVR